MDLPADVRSTLFDAGANALRFNAPLGAERADRLVGHLVRVGAESAVDIGCGRGELVRLIAAALPEATVTGVDHSVDDIDTARRLSAGHPNQRVRFEVADAGTWQGDVDAAVCVGASHAFGGSAAMFSRLAELVPSGTVIIGDGVWQATPDAWCRESFGDLPDGSAALADEAAASGWSIVESDLSTPAEWDRFEAVWIEGVRTVGTAEAMAFADQREREYHEHYRGVLGFCWLVLTS